MAKNTGGRHAADVVVMGGGVIGCAIALRLAQARLKVTVLERGEFGGEASSAAAGMIAPQGEMVEFDQFYELCAASRDLYPTFVAELEDLNGTKRNGQNLGYHRAGVLMLAASEAERQELDRVYEIQSRHGLALERLGAEEVHRRIPGLSEQTQLGVFVPGDHRVNNEQLTPALVQAGRKMGITYYSHSPVRKLSVEKNSITGVEAGGDNATLSCSGGCFILAAGCWSGELVAPLGMRLPIKPCRGQMIEFESPSELPLVLRGAHHYVVPRSPRRVLAGTTTEYAGYEKSVTGEGLRSILEGVERFAPFVKNLKFRRAWAGLRPDTADHLPIFGRGHIDNLIFATGHYRNGILLAPITASLISELVLKGSTSLCIEPYRPTRFC